MDKIRFIGNESDVYSVSLNHVSGNVIRIVFLENEMPETVGGFELVNEHNGKVMGDYSGYTTVYRTYADKNNVVELSNDESVYVEPEPVVYTVLFGSAGGGSLDGDASQTVGTYEELVVPTPVPDENYRFVGWNPEIPESGAVTASMMYCAEFEYVPTLDETKQKKITELSLACENIICGGVDLKIGGEVKHFSYKKPEDQSNIKELFDMAVSTNMPVYYHADGGDCMLYSVEEMIAVYAGNALNKNSNETYFNQMKQHIEKEMESKDDVEAILYGSPLPEERQAVVDASNANAASILQAQLSEKGIDFGDIIGMIHYTEEPADEETADDGSDA